MQKSADWVYDTPITRTEKVNNFAFEIRLPGSLMGLTGIQMSPIPYSIQLTTEYHVNVAYVYVKQSNKISWSEICRSYFLISTSLTYRFVGLICSRAQANFTRVKNPRRKNRWISRLLRGLLRLSAKMTEKTRFFFSWWHAHWEKQLF